MDSLQGKNYRMVLFVAIYHYGGKLRPAKKLADLHLEANTLQEFIETIWNNYSKHLMGHTKAVEVNQQNNSTTRTVIDEDKQLSLSSCQGKFFRLHDTVSKRKYPLSTLNESVLDL
jgi:biotin-(acetyl-CoA carboxylase) ligase